MSVAYLVLAHRGPSQVARLVDRLGAAGDPVFVHVDRKVDVAPFASQLRELRRPPVCLEERVTCHWGGFGHVEATLLGMRAALASELPFTHLVLLTGQDYPLRPAAEARAFFAAHEHRSFISWSTGSPLPLTAGERSGPGRVVRWDGDPKHLLRWHLRLRGRWYAVPPTTRYRVLRRLRPIPPGLVAAQGLAYWSLTREAVAYCLDFLAARGDVLRFFRRALIPDENIFQMILLGSPLAATLVNDDLRYLEWAGWHPRTLTADDLGDLTGSGRLFARKFDEDADATVLDLLDAVLERGAGARAGGAT